MIRLSRDEMQNLLKEEDMVDAARQMNIWLERGDGVAIYENVELGHPGLGHKQFVSFGSPKAQLEVDDPPTRMPDIGATVNWRYQLKAVYRGMPL